MQERAEFAVEERGTISQMAAKTSGTDFRISGRVWYGYKTEDTGEYY